MALGAAGQWAWAALVTRPLAALERSVTEAERKLAKTNQRLVAARAARLELAQIASASLPPPPTAAQERYQGYLIGLLHDSGIPSSTIVPGQPSDKEGVTFVVFSVQAETTLDRFARFLHSFYSGPWVQQIRRLTLNPIDRADMGSAIRFSLAIEALAFREDEAPEGERPSLPARVAGDTSLYRSIVDRNVLYAHGPGGTGLLANSPEHVVLTAIVHQDGRAEADLYDRAQNTTRRVRVADMLTVGPIRGKLLDLGLRDAVLEMDGDLWLWQLGEPLAQRRRLSLDEAIEREVGRTDRTRPPQAASP